MLENMTKEQAIELAQTILNAHNIPAVIWVREDLESIVSDYVKNEEDYAAVIDHVEDSYTWKTGLTSNAVESGWDLIRDAFVDAVSDLKVDGL